MIRTQLVIAAFLSLPAAIQIREAGWIVSLAKLYGTASDHDRQRISIITQEAAEVADRLNTKIGGNLCR